MLLYSTLYPQHSSDSASGMSKGVRFNSATPLIRKIRKATGCLKTFHNPVWAFTMSTRLKEPVIMIMLTTANAIEIS